VPVGPHLADQLLLPMALGHGGTFRTTGLTPHSQTNMSVIEAFGVARFEVQANVVTVLPNPGRSANANLTR
jgi:RNA 3'-terminal phosphate cyclase